MSQLSKNKEALQSILETVNALPSGGTLALQDKVITPSAVTQKISADAAYGGLGKVTVVGDSNLKARNIPSGITLFGVEGKLISPRAYCNLKIVFWNSAPHSDMSLTLLHPYYAATGRFTLGEDMLYASDFEENVDENEETYYTATFENILIGCLCVLDDSTEWIAASDTYTEGCELQDLYSNEYGELGVLLQVGAGETALIEIYL